MKPFPGQTVLYYFANLAGGTLDYRPAIITSVEDETTVNLFVFFEPADMEADEHSHPNHRMGVHRNEGDLGEPADAGSWDPVLSASAT